METANMMRVNARPSSYGGQGQTPQDRQQQRRQKLGALFEAVEQGNLEASKLALKMLMHVDPSLAKDVHFVRLSKALDAGGMYLAQQFVREIKTKFINATPLLVHAPKIEPTSRLYHTEGMHFVDTRA